MHINVQLKRYSEIVLLMCDLPDKLFNFKLIDNNAYNIEHSEPYNDSLHNYIFVIKKYYDSYHYLHIISNINPIHVVKVIDPYEFKPKT